MEIIIQAWLSIWLYVLTATGVVLAVKVCKNWHTWDKINILWRNCPGGYSHLAYGYEIQEGRPTPAYSQSIQDHETLVRSLQAENVKD